MFKNEIMNFFKGKTTLNTTNLSDFIELSCASAREIYISTITPQLAETIDKLIRIWNRADDELSIEWSKRQPIKLYINSTGGDFGAALSIMDSVKLSKTPVYTINTGAAYREAFLVFISGYLRYAYPKSSFLYERDLKHLDETDPYLSCYETQLNDIKDVLIEKTKLTEVEYNKHLKNIWWINTEEAKKLRICNEVLYAYQSI